MTGTRYSALLLYCPELGGDQKVTSMLSVLLLRMILQCSVSVSSLPSCVMTSHDGTLVTPSAPLTTKIIQHDMCAYVCIYVYTYIDMVIGGDFSW